MEEQNNYLIKAFRRRLLATPTTFHRYLYTDIDWDDALIGIKGPKGCGKTTMMFALTPNVDTGTLRETFFMNQLSQSHEVRYPAAGDFLVDRKYLFEVGGKGKTFDQIKDIENSYLAIDNTEIGHKNRIPLWMFGLLY